MKQNASIRSRLILIDKGWADMAHSWHYGKEKTRTCAHWNFPFFRQNFLSPKKFFKWEIFELFLKITFLHVLCHGDHFEPIKIFSIFDNYLISQLTNYLTKKLSKTKLLSCYWWSPRFKFQPSATIRRWDMGEIKMW